MMQFLMKFSRSICIVIIALLSLFCILFAILQTKWAKLQIEEKITAALQKEGIVAHIEEIEGPLPFTWRIKKIALDFGQDNELKLSNIQLRVAILPLLRGRLSINSLKVERAEYAFSFSKQSEVNLSSQDAKTFLREQIHAISIPYPIHIRQFLLSELILTNRTSGLGLSLGAFGSAKFHKKKQDFSLDINLFSPQENKTYLEVLLNGSKKTDYIAGKINIHIDSIPAFLSLPFDTALAAQMDLKGPWTTWEGILYDQLATKEALVGNIKVNMTKVNVENHPVLNRDWSFQSPFSLPSSEEIDFHSLALSSDLIQLQGVAKLCKEVEKDTLQLSFSTPDLSLWDSFLKGNSNGKITFEKGHFNVAAQTQDLTVKHYAAGTVHGEMQGEVRNKVWEADAKLFSTDAAIPFESSFSCEFIPETLLSIADLYVDCPDGKLRGYLDYAIANKQYQGSLFADVEQLERFGPLIEEKRVSGKLTAECHLSSEEQKQNAMCVLVAKNVRYQETLIDDFTLHADIEDLFDVPQGKLNFLAEKIYTPSFYLSRLNFETKSDEVQWPFFLDAEGRIESPFSCYAKGFWNFDPSLFTLELTQLTGDLAEVPFSLQYPCELQWGIQKLDLSALDFKIGSGSLFTTFELSPIRSLGKWELKHFPLEILSCFKPRFALHGHFSSQGYFDASPDRMEGVLNAVLEEAGVIHFGKTQPLNAKGVLQANLSQGRMQVHSTLNATDKQFFDFSASLPIEHTTYPLNISLDPTKNISSELLAEGKVQDLFDFVNLGTNHFAGWLSCHLFLSNTLASPSLKGELELQNGTYKNYFTGIELYSIDGTFEAKDTEIHLTKLTAKDDQSGHLLASGKILLQPEKKFPYAFEAEMNKLHAVGFDMIDCNLTGPLYLTGNLNTLNAQGNLLVAAAKIQISERLPYEIPNMPVTYINTPLHMTPANPSAHPNFTFHMDMEVTSEGTVKVAGRGLNAELEGNVHLYGTNTNIAANGTLKLIKGEYLFSGKVFKLTEGEVVFIDKPTPSAYLHLNGTLNLPDVTITAMLNGPLMAPQLTFQSNPYKPTSSILALILFNKEISEISHSEAIQLASVLVSLSGGAGPDVLESIRRSIGVDRLNIASKPGSDEVAVQIGKYLTRGIMITLSQSATSSQVIVEVELPHGFVFQAETQEEEEGKFSLKWRKTY